MSDNYLENEIIRLVKEIRDDERNITTWSGLDEIKVTRFEKAINRKLELLRILKEK